MPGRKYDIGSGYRYGFNGKENDNEVKGLGNEIDFGARIYDSRLGRWLSTDPKTNKYPGWSPYNFGINNPLNTIDPDGKDIILLIWATKDHDAGHTAIAIRNYVTVKEKVNGKWKEIHKATDTYTIYELGPAKGPGDAVLTPVEQATTLRYGLYVPVGSITMQELMENKRQDGSPVVKYDNNKPDGIIQFGNGSSIEFETDSKARASLELKNEESKMYLGVGNNCTSYCSDVIPTSPGEKLNAIETIKLDKIYKFQTPIKLFSEASKLKNANVLKSLPQDIANKGFLEAYQTPLSDIHPDAEIIGKAATHIGDALKHLRK